MVLLHRRLAIASLFVLAQAASAAPLPIAGIARVGYRVADAAKSDAFYSGVLGLPRIGATGGTAVYKVNDQQYIEIAPGLNASEDVRLTYVALETSDIRSLQRLLRSRGLSAGAPVKDARGNLSISLAAPEGTRIELVENRDDSLERETYGKLLDSPRISSHLQHVGVIVERDKLDAALRFYRDGLGCTEFWRYEPAPGDLRLVKLLLPGERHDIIELMIHSGSLSRAGIGDMHHINFEVSDIHAAHRFVLAHGAVLPLGFRPRVNAEDIWAFDLTDPDGTRIEVQDLTKIPPASIHEETFNGRQAWVLANGWMRVSLLAGGGHIAEVRLLSDDPKKNLNPMRVPHYPTIEPYEYDPARDDAVYGTTPHRWLSSGYMGHLLCFPMYGPPSVDEARAGLGNHGEAPIVRWSKIKEEVNTDGVTLWYGADLPKTQFRVERAVTLPRGMRTLYVQEWVENLAPFDRPINWMEHATFGPPFVEPGKTVLDSSGTAIAWEGKGLADTPAALRVFQPTPHSGTYYAMRADPARKEQFFALYHPDYRVLLGYVFPSEGNGWINDWQENRSITELPWNGQVIARGIEFGSTPFAEGLRTSVERSSLLGAPAYRWIGAHQRLKTEFTIFVEEIPLDYQGVANVYTEHGIPIVTASAFTGTHGTYTTNFPLTENPISESGNWENGKAIGLDWADAATFPGHAFGLESGTKGYDDAAALLTGRWGPDQTAQATVYSVKQNDNIYEEVELRLRSSLSAHSATGYEILFRCSKTKNAYAEIVRWNGPLGSFTYLDRHRGAQFGVATGDVVKATIVGNVITAYINGVQVAQATDSTYPTGQPGVGFFLQGTTGVNRDYGFTSFTASDGR